MKLEMWVFKQALELYPKAVRDQFGSAMLETYSDGLKAAKLEGRAFAFHWNTVWDAVRSVARATAEVKDADPVSRATAVLGIIFLLLLISGLTRLFWDLTWNTLLVSVGALLMFGIARVGHYHYQTKYQKIFAVMFTLFGVMILLNYFMGQFIWRFFPLEYAFFSAPQNYPDADLRIIVLGYIVKFFWTVPVGLFILGSVLDTIDKRRILPMNQFNYLLIVFNVLLQIVDPGLQILAFRILYFVYIMIALILFLFLCLRLWQQPRALPRVAKAA